MVEAVQAYGFSGRIGRTVILLSTIKTENND